MTPRRKSTEAIFTGLAIWTGGFAAVLLTWSHPLFPTVVPFFALITAPLMWALTLFHLRNVPRELAVDVAIRFGLLVTAVQAPLDSLLLFSGLELGWPQSPFHSIRALAYSLPASYFLMLITPWLVGRHAARKPNS